MKTILRASLLAILTNTAQALPLLYCEETVGNEAATLVIYKLKGDHVKVFPFYRMTVFRDLETEEAFLFSEGACTPEL
jgi:hypothetical protein